MKITKISKYIIALILIIIIWIFSYKIILRNSDNFINNGKASKIKELISKSKEPIKNSEYIESWMTFKYINFIFKIHPNYISEKLEIKDDKYPNITIWKYIKKNRLDANETLTKIKKIVSEFLENNNK